MSKAVEPAKIRKVGSDLVDIKVEGFLGEADGGYLRDVAALLAEQPDKMFVLYDLSGLTGFYQGQVMAHARAYAEMAPKVHAIAATHVTAAVRFGIVTVALFTQLTVKGFATRKEGEAWIASLRDSGVSRAV